MSERPPKKWPTFRRNLQRITDLKELIATLDAERKELEAWVLDNMAESDQQTVEWESATGTAMRATAVYSSTVKIDEAGLQAALGPHKWAQVTRRTLDERLLEDKVAKGAIDIEVVAEHSTEVPRKPYLKITGGK